jgi:hypothetical protein
MLACPVVGASRPQISMHPTASSFGSGRVSQQRVPSRAPRPQRCARRSPAPRCRASTTAAAEPSAAPPPPGAGDAPPRPRASRGSQSQQLQQLVREVLDTALSTGPRGVMRGLQAARAVAGLAAEYAAAGRLEPPQARATAARPPRLDAAARPPRLDAAARPLPSRPLSPPSPTPSAPFFGFQVVLRKLFERLGVTFIKLGQFIASTPSLFPAEYVEEFQARRPGGGEVGGWGEAEGGGEGALGAFGGGACPGGEVLRLVARCQRGHPFRAQGLCLPSAAQCAAGRQAAPALMCAALPAPHASPPPPSPPPLRRTARPAWTAPTRCPLRPCATSSGQTWGCRWRPCSAPSTSARLRAQASRRQARAIRARRRPPVRGRVGGSRVAAGAGGGGGPVARVRMAAALKPLACAGPPPPSPLPDGVRAPPPAARAPHRCTLPCWRAAARRS